MSCNLSLPSLTPREAVADAMYRALIAFDRNDVSMFNTIFAGEDSTLELISGEKKAYTGLSALRKELFDHVGPLDTTHMVNNVRVDVKDGADTASMTAYVLAQHCPPGRGREPDGPKWLAGGEASLSFVWDEKDGLWKVKKWVMEVMWSQGDPSVMQGLRAAESADHS
ncbi:MAG: hypothetical protein Q9160_007961 [Pyrenula sp. 1 TL-2023]